MKRETPRYSSEIKGFLNFSRETIQAFGLALIFIVYVAQAFKIPSESMEGSLLNGDHLLAAKFMYGSPLLPFSYKKLPAVKNPEPGEVVIFKVPNNQNKEYIKRCIAGPGQIVMIDDTVLSVNGKIISLPPQGKFLYHGAGADPQINHFSVIRVPAKGDTLYPSVQPVREFLFSKHLLHQESPHSSIHVTVQLLLDSISANTTVLSLFDNKRMVKVSMEQLNSSKFFDSFDNWITFRDVLEQLKSQIAVQYPENTVELRPVLYRDGIRVDRYIVNQDNYFMMGDNRDNSLDSRYWGFVNRAFINAQAGIIFFSLDPDVPYWNLIKKIRWNRIGKLIRSWNSTENQV